MGKGPLFVIIALLLSACASETISGGPRLVQDVALEPTTPAPTRFLSPTPSPTPVAIPISTSEVNVPLQVATVDVDFVLVTPTLPPSKTPTGTPTQTPTVTVTPSPTLTSTATATALLVPTSVVQQVTAIVAQPQAVTCNGQWFFAQPPVSTCPAGPPMASRASLLQFQQGYMVWIDVQDAIYVLYDSANSPRWQVFNDTFDEGMMEFDPGWGEGPPYTFQPRRGFGKVWRERPEVRQRLGWAVREWSEPYSAQVQTASDGSVFIQESRGGVFSLMANGSDWKRYDGFGGF
ncbi:MAG: hypothetical protein K8L99_33965 [Anaerolineae bacterium]|nr:hypothetical protein [Anaerolineae bacterium]